MTTMYDMRVAECDKLTQQTEYLRCQLDLHKVACAEMRDALKEAKVTCESDDHIQSHYALEKINHALSNECGKDHFSREQVMPLVTMLQDVLEVADLLDCPEVHWSDKINAALIHAKKIGLIQ